MSFEELVEDLDGLTKEMGRLGLGVRHTEDLEGVIVSPKERITPEIREAIRKHKRHLATHLVWLSYCEWVGESDMDAYPPFSPEMRKAYEEGDPKAFHKALDFYDQVRGRWPVLRAVLSSPAGAGLVVPKRGGGLIAVLPEDDSVPSKRLPRRERRHKSRRKKGRKKR